MNKVYLLAYLFLYLFIEIRIFGYCIIPVFMRQQPLGADAR